MKTPLNDNLNKAYEAFNRDHNHLRESLMTSLPQRPTQPKHTSTIAYIRAFIGDTVMKSRITKLAAVAIIIIAVSVILNQFASSVDGTSVAFAKVLEQIEKAKTITWKITFYIQVTSKDGKRTWIETETRQQAYKAPGLYRDVHFDEDGQITHWTITDTVNMEELSVNPGEKRATVRELTMAMNPRGPFVWQKEEMRKRNLEWVGKVETETGEANIFRTAFRDKANNQDWSYDFWIDAKTKKLVAVQVPGADIYDPVEVAKSLFSRLRHLSCFYS